MEKLSSFEEHINKINKNAYLIINNLNDMDLTFEEGMQALKKALNILERASLKNKIKNIHQENRL